MVPPEYHEYLDVFDEDKANRFPESRQWDHKIELKEGFEPKSFQNYNLTPEEQIKLDNFLKENLEKGYIRPSKSPMASLFFFVKKKDGKLQPCQDYRYLMLWLHKSKTALRQSKSKSKFHSELLGVSLEVWERNIQVKDPC